MIFFDFVFDVFVKYATSGFFWLWFSPLFVLFFIAVVPRLIRELLVWR